MNTLERQRQRVGRLQVGDIVRVTRFYVRGDGMTDGLMWALVCDQPNNRATVQVEAFYCDTSTMLGEEALDGDDGWHVVRADKLPNYVCVALAKWRLTGERTVVS